MNYGEYFVRAMGINPLCAERLRLNQLVHAAFQLCDTHLGARPFIVSAVGQLLRLLHQPDALLEHPRRFSPRAPLQWVNEHKRLIELKKADARIQVLAVLLVAIVAMAREPSKDYMGVEFATQVLKAAQANYSLPCELRSVMLPPSRAHHIVKYDADHDWYNNDAIQDHDKLVCSTRHARMVWSSYYQTAVFGLERQCMSLGGHLRWAEPDAVLRGGAPPPIHDAAVAAKAAQAARVGLMVCEFESLPRHLRGAEVSPQEAQNAYGKLHCRERFLRLAHDHTGFWTPRSGFCLSPMWHAHFPMDDALRTAARSAPTTQQPASAACNSTAAALAPTGSRLACLVRTFSSALRRPGKPPQSNPEAPGASRQRRCCSRRQRAQKESGAENERTKQTSHEPAHKKHRQF